MELSDVPSAVRHRGREMTDQTTIDHYRDFVDALAAHAGRRCRSRPSGPPGATT
jgi:hypothetical protein